MTKPNVAIHKSAAFERIGVHSYLFRIGRANAVNHAESRGRGSPCARRTTKSPSTKASIRVLRKQSNASSGVHTTGSFSLKDVLSTIGTPVSSEKAWISR